MAQVVELFGAPGAGKSSLMHALDGRRVGGRRIIAAPRLTRVPRSGLFGRLRPRALAPAERRAALLDRRDDWELLLACVASSARSSETDPIRALYAPGWLAATLELRALADRAPDGLIVVIDEGFVQRAPIVCGLPASDDCLTRFLSAVPPPLLHVQLEQDARTLATRLLARDRVLPRHEGLDAAALAASVSEDARLLARCAAGLARAGAPVLTIGRSDSPEALADRVVAALSGEG